MQIKKKSHPLGQSRWQGKEIDGINFDFNKNTQILPFCQEKSLKYQVFICKSCGEEYIFDPSISSDKQDYCPACLVSGRYLSVVN